jgi:hypothetical protein
MIAFSVKWCSYTQNLRRTSTRTGCDGIRSPAAKKVLEDNSFIRSRLQGGLRVRRSAISFGKIASIVLHRLNAGFHDIRLTKVVTDPSKSSHRDNLHAPGVVEGSFVVLRIAGLALTIGFYTKWRSSLHQGLPLLVFQRTLPLLCRGLFMLHGDLRHFLQSQ